MNLTNNGKATMVLAATVAALDLYYEASAQANPEWIESLSSFSQQFFPINSTVVIPIFTVLYALAILWVWQAKRAGFILALALGSLYLLFYVLFIVERLGAGLTLVAGMHAISAVVAALLAWYAFKGQRELKAEQGKDAA